MKKATAFSLLVALATSPAFAGGPADHGGHRPSPPQSATSSASASSVARGGMANSNAIGGTGGTGGTARATGGNGYGGAGYGGSTSVTVQGGGGNNAGTGPAIFLPSLAGNASCGGSISLGGIGSSAGASGGGMWEFHDCKVAREAAELHALGRPDLALRLMCQQIDRVKEAMGGSCDAPVPQTVASKPDYCWTASAGEMRQHKECR
jgi:hypothetical protein